MKGFTNGVAPAAQAVTLLLLGPVAPKRIETCPLARLPSTIAGKRGRRGWVLSLRVSYARLPRILAHQKRANVHADAVRHALRDAQTRVLHGFVTRSQSIVDEAIHAAQVAFVDIVLRSKILHFPGNLSRIPCASKRVIGPMPDTP